MRWPWSQARRRKHAVRTAAMMATGFLRQCHWCEFTSSPIEVLFHEVEVHKA
jgi:hypothetical protein